ncbi:hypothetical protein F5J12DRAFT_780726 [Pisolithus orientalis]|uniref:uncharacterized protein n=1 Tax=Pisolithus orientalis TaxID=936130 RepID=UPI002225680F|nr:uncharacterized protein F5J12DRAFT_780726 [Pisolithus orientalis]KAI6019589.1 hypothetical protein F5J12DRAFT_780726 [Pisolithus orientalis]
MVAPVFEGQNGHLPMPCNHGSFTMVQKTPAYIAMVPYYTLQLPDNPSSTLCLLYCLLFLMAINHSATQDITHYMCWEFSSQTFPGPNAPKPDPPLYIPTYGIVATNQIVASMHVAYNNRKHSSINLIWLSECLSAMELGVDETQEAGHLAAHPSSLTSFVDEPMVILGTGNTIALWYLPSAITNDLQASLQTHMLATSGPPSPHNVQEYDKWLLAEKC